jgi:hypothetical protein
LALTIQTAVSVVEVPVADILIRAVTRQPDLTRTAEMLCVFVIRQPLAPRRKTAFTRAIACASVNSAARVADNAALAPKVKTAMIVPRTKRKNDLLIFISPPQPNFTQHSLRAAIFVNESDRAPHHFYSHLQLI